MPCRESLNDAPTCRATLGHRRDAAVQSRRVTASAAAVDEFAQQQGAAITELPREAAELVPSIGLCQRLRLRGNGIAGEHGEAGGRGHFICVQSELVSQFAVQPQ